MMRFAKVLFVALVLFFGTITLFGETAKKEGIEMKPVPRSNISSGAQMYKDYCAVCHGVDGRSDGPATTHLKTAVPELRTLALRNHGKYPNARVATILRDGLHSTPPGELGMPTWGALFRPHDGAATELRIQNITKFIGTLQQQ
jgi:mono/diheme cytochrome c family protein